LPGFVLRPIPILPDRLPNLKVQNPLFFCKGLKFEQPASLGNSIPVAGNFHTIEKLTGAFLPLDRQAWILDQLWIIIDHRITDQLEV
jgi:hypothetical protein